MSLWSHRSDAFGRLLLAITGMWAFRLGTLLETGRVWKPPTRIWRFTLVESGMGVVAVNWL